MKQMKAFFLYTVTIMHNVINHFVLYVNITDDDVTVFELATAEDDKSQILFLWL